MSKEQSLNTDHITTDKIVDSGSKSKQEIIDLFDSTKLDFYANDFQDLDFLLSYREKFGQIKILDLSGNNLKELPHWIGEFENLEELFLNGNSIRELPSEIGRLSHLKILDVSGNLIGILPQEIGNLDLDQLTVDELKPENQNLREKISNIVEVMNFEDDGKWG